MNRRVNNQMIALARESRGMTQSTLATAIQVTQATLSKFESGAITAGEEHVAKLAKFLNYPDEFFFQTEQIRWTGSGCMYHRKRQALTATEYRQLLARVNILRINMWRLLQGTEVDCQNQFFRMDIADYGSAPKVAALLRNSWNLPPGPVLNITEAIEAAGGIVLKCDFGTSRLDAFSQWPPGMPPMFFVNQSVPPDRYRWTLAHEIGHIVMHVVPTIELEREADAFAAEFLMPARDIVGHLGRPFTLARAAELKRYWRVSMAALIRRAKDTNRISDSYYRALMTQLSARGYRKSEPVALEDEQPTIMKSVVDVHLRKHGYSVEDLSRMALMTESEFRERFAAETRQTVPHLRPVK
jgi:Zn-dependent peptidase ImmA (M78 family)/transcriptional regulator with XRE-family HTH domain